MLIGLIIVLGVIAIGMLLIDEYGAFITFLIAFFIAVIYRESTSPEWQERTRKAELDAQRAAIPHVIREADGCKVYAFTTDREHYFTRCGSTVTTETNWTKSCGKSCTRHESDTITTEGNK